MLPDIIKIFPQLLGDDIDVLTGTLTDVYNIDDNGAKGFIVTDEAFSIFVNENDLEIPLLKIFGKLDKENFSNLAETGKVARQLILGNEMPHKLALKIKNAHYRLCGEDTNATIAVTTNTTDRGPREINKQGQDSFSNIRGEDALVSAVEKCFASLFTDKAIYYRVLNGFSSIDIPISIRVRLVNTDHPSLCYQ